MPPDFLLPLFALTLIANAVLVAVAIRTMRRGDPDRDRSIGARRQASPTPFRPGPTVSPERQAPIAAGPAPILAGSPAVAGPQPAVEPFARADPGATVAPPPRPPAPDIAANLAADLDRSPGPERAPEEPAPEPPARPKRRRSTKASLTAPASRSAAAGGPATNGGTPDGAGAPPPPEPRPRGRRRFSLPPLDDDHEKVSQSIKTFLAGVEAPSSDQPADTPRATSAGATTVALVAVAGLRDVERANGPVGRSASAGAAGSATETDPAAEALAMVERTLRGAARGTDVVTVDGGGRYRIVLPGTGELAARAYLRRIRASIEPLLEAADGPLRLAVATATVLDEPIDDAVRRAERRLAAALDQTGAAGLAGSTDGAAGAVGAVPRTPRAAAD